MLEMNSWCKFHRLDQSFSQCILFSILLEIPKQIFTEIALLLIYVLGYSQGKIRIWTFGSLVYQINTFELLTLEQIFQKNKVVTGKTPIFVISPFCSRNSVCLNIGF